MKINVNVGLENYAQFMPYMSERSNECCLRVSGVIRDCAFEIRGGAKREYEVINK